LSPGGGRHSLLPQDRNCSSQSASRRESTKSPPFPSLSTRISSPPQLLHSPGALLLLRVGLASRKVLCSQSADILKLCRSRFSVAGGSSRVSRRGKSGSRPVNWCPGVAASEEVLPSKAGWKRLNRKNSRCEPRGNIVGLRALTSSGARCSFAYAKDGKQNIRDNGAARVAGPGRICFLR